MSYDAVEIEPQRVRDMAPRRHPIPDAALDADIAILGKKGRGKTYTAKGVVERLLDMNRRVLVLDPLSTWWGLKARADGKEGYPVVVFGGPHADIELSEAMGRPLGRLLAAENIPAVVDLGSMRKAEQARLVGDLLEELFARNREPLWLVLEEADAFAPQQPMGDHNMRVLGEVDRIARRGRAFGFRLISISQRAAKLHKDVLSQLATLVALGVTSPQDRDAIKSWVEGNADRDKAKEVMNSMADLGVGEGWVWAPDLKILDRVKFPAIKTLDTSSTPQAGERRASAQKLAKADVGKIETLLKKESGDAKPVKPKASATPPAAQPSATALKEAEERGRAAAWKEAEMHATRVIEELRKEIDRALGRAESALKGTSARALPVPTPKPQAKMVPSSRASDNAKSSEDVTGPESKMLAALAWWRSIGQEEPSRAMAATVCGWRVTSGHVANVASSLSTKGLISYPSSGRLGLTPKGTKAAPSPPAGDIHEMVRAVMTGPQQQVFEALLDAGGSCSREEICERIGWNPTSGHIANVVSSLATMEFVTYPKPGHVALVPWLME